METRTVRRALPWTASPVAVLRVLREQPGLVALVGDWVEGPNGAGARDRAGARTRGDGVGGLDADGRDADRVGGDGIDAVIGIRPTRTLDAEEDPFEGLGGETAVVSSAASTTPGGVFGGGWIGYLGYQLSRQLEDLPQAPPRAGELPEHHLAHYDHVLLHHARTGRWTCEALPGTDPARVARTLEIVDRALGDRMPGDRPLDGRAGSEGAGRGAGGTSEREGAPSSSAAAGAREYRCEPFEATVSGAAHADAVRRALHHIRDGDIFQANICRGLHARFHGDPLDLFCAGYERLRPRFAAFLRVPGGAVASLSPELYLRRAGERVLTSPIKGTAPADSDPRELHASAKNRAENVMIVDLMRNDLSRACLPGSVLSPAVPRVEPHTGVHHLVADVHGTLRPGLDDADLLRATFPPGSCTGAPKIRAMEIINALEATARGVYTGAVGCVSPAAGLALNVAIRTFEFSGDTVRLGVGGGIVADSDPDGEAFETLVKAAPLLDAVGAHFGAKLSREWHEHLAREGSGVTIPACVSLQAGCTPVRDGSTPARDGTPVRGGTVEPDGPTALEGVPRPPLDASRGVFTTVLVRGGVPEHLDRHLSRLGASVRECCGAELPLILRGEVLDRAAGLEGPHRLRITAVPSALPSAVPGAVPRGEDCPAEAPEVTGAVAGETPSAPVGGSSEGAEAERAARPLSGVRCEITSAPLNPPSSTPPEEPWTLVPCVVPGGLGRHKWADRRVLEHAPGQSSPVEDALLADRDGTVLETGRANVFVVLDGVVVTPPTDGRILPGVMRARVLELLRETGHEVRERALTLQECARATEVFVTNALRGARPVGEIRGVGRWDVGPVTRHLGAVLGAGGAASSSGRGA